MSDSNYNNIFNGIDRSAPISDIAQQILERAFNVVQVNEDDDDLYAVDDDGLDVDIDLDDASYLDEDAGYLDDLGAVDIEGGSDA